MQYKAKRKKKLNYFKYVGFSDTIFFLLKIIILVYCPNQTIFSCLFDYYILKHPHAQCFWVMLWIHHNPNYISAEIDYLEIDSKLKNNVQ